MEMIAQEEAVAMPGTPELKRKFGIKDIVQDPNLASKLSAEHRNAIGQWVVGGYVKDLSSRIQWTQRNSEAIKLALQFKEDKTFPWTGASNVKFPLVTIAALQFLARISILSKGRKLARYEHVGADATGEKMQRAARISTHTSLQLVDEDVAWLDNDEQAKFAASLVGSAFKKTYFDPVQGTNISEYVPAMHFVFDYHCKHIDTTARATHVISLSANKIRERVARGLFIEEEDPQAPGPEVVTNLLRVAADEIAGLWNQGGSEEYRVLEQHCWFDFDGDGYAEPYIISVREDTGHVYRIVARFFDDGDVHRVNDLAVRQAEALAMQAQDMKVKSDYEKQAKRLEDVLDNKIVRIDPVKYFTKYTFIPSPDGGALGLGLGSLLGPVNAAVDTLINQLIDSGTMANTAGGFMGRGVKLKGGKTTFDPFEWKPVDSTGDDLRKNIMPLPVRDPSAVLFQLLGILITYGEKLGSATDIMTGVSPGQNTPAETSRNTVEQGMMLFSGIYARMYRSFRSELQKFYELNRLYLHTSPSFWDLTQGPDAIIAPDDYSQGRFRVFPAADASTLSGQQRKDKADKLAAFASSPLGVKLDKDSVTRQWLEANEYDVDAVFPDPAGPRAVQPPPNPKAQLEQGKLQLQQQQHADTMQLEVGKLKAEMALNEGKLAKLQADAELSIAKADGFDKEQSIALLNAQIGAARAHNESLLKTADMLLKAHATKSDIESEHHQRLLDIHDRIQSRQDSQQQKDALAQQGQPQVQGGVDANPANGA